MPALNPFRILNPVDQAEVALTGYVQVESRVRINRPLVGVLVCCVVFWGLVIAWAVGR